MDVPTVQRFAQEEQSALTTRAKADRRWRQKWWATTVALAEVTGRVEIGAACRAVAAETATSVGYASQRRRVGLAFANLEVDGLDSLPPRHAKLLVDQNKLTGETIARLRQVDDEGLSLREYAAELGLDWGDRQPARTRPKQPARPRPVPPGEPLRILIRCLEDCQTAVAALLDSQTEIPADIARRATNLLVSVAVTFDALLVLSGSDAVLFDTALAGRDRPALTSSPAA